MRSWPDTIRWDGPRHDPENPPSGLGGPPGSSPGFGARDVRRVGRWFRMTPMTALLSPSVEDIPHGVVMALAAGLEPRLERVADPLLATVLHADAAPPRGGGGAPRPPPVAP